MTGKITYTTNHKYRVVPYLADWPKWYTKEAARLQKIYGDAIHGIEHVGSTSVPGMAAKPQLDILVQMSDISKADAFNNSLQAIGYEAYGDALQKGGRFYSKWEHGEKVVNLHVYQPDAHAVWEYVAVRDYLRGNPQEAKDYAALKIELYKKYPTDYLKYREIKDAYMAEMIKRIIRAT